MIVLGIVVVLFLVIIGLWASIMSFICFLDAFTDGLLGSATKEKVIFGLMAWTALTSFIVAGMVLASLFVS